MLIELAEADSNLPQALRVHFGFTEDVLVSKDKAFQQRWFNRIANGETVGSAWSEGGKESIDQFETHLYRDSEGKIRVKGKILHHRSLYADWVDVGVTDLRVNLAQSLFAVKMKVLKLLMTGMALVSNLPRVVQHISMTYWWMKLKFYLTMTVLNIQRLTINWSS